MAQQADAILAPALPASDCRNPKAHGTIIVAGERIELEGQCVVTFLDDPAWDFARLGETTTRPGHYVESRRVQDEARREVQSLPDAQEVVDMVVLHSDITADSRTCFQVLKMRGFSTHFMVDWDGTIYQGTDVARMAIHAASQDFRKNVNNFSIGIDVNCLQVNHAGGKPPAEGSQGERRMSETIEINNVQWQSWGYTDAQYRALIALLKKLASILPKLKLMAPLGEDNSPIWSVVEKYNPDIGIYGHLHLTAEKFDPGPGFDWHRLIYGLTEETNHFPLALTDPKTKKDVELAGLQGDAEVDAAARLYFLHTELAGKGGYYPIGLSGQWHGGVHLFAPRGTDVRAMTDGVVVAARNAEPGPLGSANFVLLRHEVLFGDPKDERRFVFYSLYMHLLRFDPERDASDAEKKGTQRTDEAAAPEWLTLAKQIVTGKEGAADGPATIAKAKRKAGDDDDDEVLRKEQPLLPMVGEGIDALRRGEVALLPADGPTARRVAAGTVIGRVGETGDEDDLEAVLHLEVFANSQWRNIVDLLGVHGKFWYDVEADSDDNLLVDSESLLRQVLPSVDRKKLKPDPTFLRSGRRVRPDDIEAFYREPDDPELRDRLRLAITRHVSEWSDQVDWLKLLANAQSWDDKAKQLRDLLEADGSLRDALFARQIARQLPFIWLTKDVAKHVGVMGELWDGVLDHFHPIHFLIWLTFHSNTRARELAKGKSKREIAKDRAQAAKKAEAARLAGEWEDDHGGEEAPSALDDVGNPAQILEELWEAPSQPGEWRRKD
jgi:N-acetyl-anhydromuramyl-L-alanine amidase AmpD/murein DD-endopeptidase MepM/ murein hydrolase activator NlpD